MSTNNYLENNRTVFMMNNKDVNMNKHILGLIIYVIVFVICIPYLLIKYKLWNILSAYFPNLDLIASVIGYHGGPHNTFIWTHLYNPADSTLVGYITSNVINLFALLGVTYIIAYYTFITNNIYKGWSRAFIMLPMTYFIPSNFIIYYMNKYGNYLNKYLSDASILHYLLVVLLGLFIASLFILLESQLIDKLSKYIISGLKYIY